LQEECRAFSGFRYVGEDTDGAVGLAAMAGARARTGPHPQAFVGDGHAPIGTDFEQGAAAPDIRPCQGRRAAGGRGAGRG
jgi:hypothetical protein